MRSLHVGMSIEMFASLFDPGLIRNRLLTAILHLSRLVLLESKSIRKQLLNEDICKLLLNTKTYNDGVVLVCYTERGSEHKVSIKHQPLILSKGL